MNRAALLKKSDAVKLAAIDNCMAAVEQIEGHIWPEQETGK